MNVSEGQEMENKEMRRCGRLTSVYSYMHKREARTDKWGKLTCYDFVNELYIEYTI